MMLNPEIQKFIGEIKKLNVTGCILVPQSDRPALLSALKQASVIIGDKPQPGRVTYYLIKPQEPLTSPIPPALFIATEEDYSRHPPWAEQIRQKADYFLNVKSADRGFD
jgi:hypothetical protein